MKSYTRQAYDGSVVKQVTEIWAETQEYSVVDVDYRTQPISLDLKPASSLSNTIHE